MVGKQLRFTQVLFGWFRFTFILLDLGVSLICCPSVASPLRHRHCLAQEYPLYCRQSGLLFIEEIWSNGHIDASPIKTSRNVRRLEKARGSNPPWSQSHNFLRSGRRVGNLSHPPSDSDWRGVVFCSFVGHQTCSFLPNGVSFFPFGYSFDVELTLTCDGVVVNNSQAAAARLSF